MKTIIHKATTWISMDNQDFTEPPNINLISNAADCCGHYILSLSYICGDILKDCLKGEPSTTTTHIAVYITYLCGLVNTQTIQPVCREQFCFSEVRVQHCSGDSAALWLYRPFLVFLMGRLQLDPSDCSCRWFRYLFLLLEVYHTDYSFRMPAGFQANPKC